MKKILSIICILGLLLCIIGCDRRNQKEITDAIKFKEEYESINDTVREKDGKKIRSITIDSDNPMVYKTANDIVNAINNKESFLVYFGFSDCPWCRSVVPYMIEVAKSKNINQIYYVDVNDIRDTKELDDNNKVIITKEGSEDYYKLLEKLSDVLSDYNLKDKNGKNVKTSEKRIYAPNIVAVVDGMAVKMESGNSDLQTDGYMELSDEIITDMKDKLNCVMSCLDEKNTCNKDKC